MLTGSPLLSLAIEDVLSPVDSLKSFFFIFRSMSNFQSLAYVIFIKAFLIYRVTFDKDTLKKNSICQRKTSRSRILSSFVNTYLILTLIVGYYSNFFDPKSGKEAC